MKSPDGLALLHGSVYDRQKAHDYYLRTRHLKGRRKGGDDNSGGNSRAGPGPSKHRPATKEAQVAALQAKLDHLHDVLAKLVEQAKRRSGVDIKDSSSKKSANSKDSGGGSKKKSDLTAQEKKEKATKAREDYKKEKRTENKSSPSEEIASLQKRIQEVRAQIKDAIEEARRKSTSKSKTAPKGR